MKYKISFLLTLLLLLASCQQEFALGEDGGTTAGKGHISFRVASMASGGAISLDDVEFKSVFSKAMTDIQESVVNRMDVVVYEVGGGRLTTYSQGSVNVNDFSPKFIGCDGKTCNIYFVANLIAPPTFPDTEDAFKKSTCGLDRYVQSDVIKYGIPMSGSLLNCTIPSGGVIANAPVTLTRLLARVDVVYTNSVPTQFTASSLQLCNVPTKVPYYNDVTTAPATYYTPEMPVDNFTPEVNPPNNGVTYTYYIPANRKGDGSPKNTDPRLKNGSGITTPTCVKITNGVYIYTFYLGADDCNNYDILANTKYTVNANIKGVSSFDSRITVTAQPESNCYIVAPGGTIYIPVSRAEKGYTGAGGSFTAGTDITTGVLWCDVPTTANVTASVVPGNKFIKVVASNTEGNSVVYAMSGSTIVWSWHIWVTNYNPSTTANTSTNTATYNNNNMLWMDRNLGATTATAGLSSTRGLYYQWGRKDPFPGAAANNINTRNNLSGSINEIVSASATERINLLNSIKKPGCRYLATSVGTVTYDWYTPNIIDMNDYLWSNGTNSAKTIYDPCPDGWRVPLKIASTSPWNGFTVSKPLIDFGTTWGGSFYPAAGNMSWNSNNFAEVNTGGSYWSGSMMTSGVMGVLYLMFDENGVTPNNYRYTRASAYSVRCVKL